MSLTIVGDDERQKALRELTKSFYGLEKPLMSKYEIKIDSLDDLTRNLHAIFSSDSVNIELVNHLMMIYTSNYQEWKKFAKFDRYRYTRNLVDAGNGRFNLMILCWNEGQSSTIHDHADSHCFMKVLKGTLNEVKYEFPKENAKLISEMEPKDADFDEELKEISRSSMYTNDVCYINDNIGLHRVENASNVETAVSLHLYCPPFDKCSVFNKAGKSTEAKVTFWSKFGKRINNDD